MGASPAGLTATAVAGRSTGYSLCIFVRVAHCGHARRKV